MLPQTAGAVKERTTTMSHDIEQDGNQASFVSAREDAWHQLGTTLDDTFDAETALEVAHLANWNVRKMPLFLAGGQEVEGQFANVRDNPYHEGQIDVLGIVGNHYDSFQNESMTEMLNALVDESGAHFETAGSLNGGRNTFVTMKVPNHILIGGKDAVDTYIAVTNSHDGNSSLKMITTPVRIVCANTQRAALNAATGKFSKRHTAGGSGVVMSQVREVLDVTFKYVEEFEKEAELLYEQAYTDQQFRRLTASLYPTADNASTVVANNQAAHRAALVDLFQNSPTAAGIRGTKWAAVQAVTEYLDHTVLQRGKAGQALAQARSLTAINPDSPANHLKERAFALLAK